MGKQAKSQHIGDVSWHIRHDNELIDSEHQTTRNKMAKAHMNYTIKRALILKSAENLFLSNGYESTTMDAVAREAGVTKQTVYRYFSSKIDLFSALVKNKGSDTDVFSFGTESTTIELQRYAEAFVSAHMLPERIGLYRLMICESARNPEIGTIFRSQLQPQWETTLTAFLQARLHLEKPQIYAKLFNTMLVYMRSSIIMGLSAPPSPAEVVEHVRLVVDVFCHGASKSEGCAGSTGGTP